MTTVVLGLDGAAFDLIQPWIDDETLPTFARLVDEGAATDMQSCPPPVTCPNWQCYATGTNPGKLGVFWWEHVDAVSQSIESTSASHQFDGRHYWHYLDGKSAVINLPTSYPPPDDINGVHISGGPGAEQSGYTMPADLEDDLSETYNYAVHPENLGNLSVQKPDSECVGEVYNLIETRFDVLEDYVKAGEFEFIHLTVFYINVLQHFYWDNDVVREAWKRIDKRIANLLEQENLDTLFVMSDHGSNEIEISFLVNAWLEREGYLTTTTGINDVLYRLGFTRERVRPIIASLGIEWWLRRLLPRHIQTLLPDSKGSVTEGAKEDIINWDTSVALASGQGPLYVLSEDPVEHERIRDELLARLDGLEYDGKQIIEAAVPAEEVYNGPYINRAPDIVLRQAPGVHIEGAVGRERDPFETPSYWRGENKETGLFLAYGPDIDPAADLPEMHILDIAPTVLHLRATPIPSNLDGKVRTDLFVDQSDPATREPRTQAPADMSVDADTGTVSEVSDRLRNLGYLQ